MSTSTPTPGRWILRWGGYTQIVDVYRDTQGRLRFVVASGMSHDVATVPDAVWTPLSTGGAQ